MKGLLLKDAYQIWHYAKGVIVAAVVMMGAGVVTIMNGANFFIVYAGFLMGMMPMTLLAYDQASKFSEYSGVLPVTKEQLWAANTSLACAGWCWRNSSPPQPLAWQACTGQLWTMRLWFPRWCR